MGCGGKGGAGACDESQLMAGAAHAAPKVGAECSMDAVDGPLLRGLVGQDNGD